LAVVFFFLVFVQLPFLTAKERKGPFMDSFTKAKPHGYQGGIKCKMHFAAFSTSFFFLSAM